MPNEVSPSVAGDVKQSVEQSNMSIGDYAAFRLGSAEKAKAEKPKPAEAAPKESAPAVEEVEKEQEESHEGTAPEATPEAEGKEVPSNNLADLSDEEISELAQKGKSGLLKRIAELTAKRKLAEEKLAQYEAYVAKQQQDAKTAHPEVKPENNPFNKIKSIEELSQKAAEMGEVVEWAEDVLFNAADIAATDVAVVQDGKEYTKAEVRHLLQNARKARDKFIPAQRQLLEANAQREAMKKAFSEQAVKEFDWLRSKEDNDLKRRFTAMLSDPRLKAVEEAAPDVAAQLPYLLAHAANSMYGRKTIPIEGKPSVKVTPPSSPGSEAAISGRSEERGSKVLKESSKRFMETGSIDDFISLRTAKYSKQ